MVSLCGTWTNTFVSRALICPPKFSQLFDPLK